MSTLQNTDNFQVDTSGTQNKVAASIIRTGTKSYDNLMVERSNTLHKLEKERRYDVNYTDLFAVERSGTTYKVTGEDYFDYMWTYTKSSAHNESVSSTLFGYSVAVGHGLVAIGAPNYNSTTVGGRVRVYNLSGTLQFTLTVPSFGGQFGRSVAIGSNKIVVGCPFFRTSSSSSQSGRAYIFDLDGTNQITLSGVRGFGNRVAVGEGKVAVGSASESGTPTGACYVYNTNGTGQTKLTGTVNTSGASYGSYVAIGSGVILVGQEEFSATYLNGRAYVYNASTLSLSTIIVGGNNEGVGANNTRLDVDDNVICLGTMSGGAHLYNLDGTKITTINKPAAATTRFGNQVSVGSGRIVITDYEHSSSTGRVYVYDLSGTLVTTITGSTTNERFGAQIDIDKEIGCIVSSSRYTTNGSWWSIGNTQR